MFTCPNCGKGLSRQQTKAGIFWGCTCGGRAVGIALLRHTISNPFVTQAWAAACNDRGTPGRRCPVCSRPMTEVPVTALGQTMKLDVCAPCQFMWFDPEEYDSVPISLPSKSGEEPMPQAAREALALYKVEQIAKQSPADDASPDEQWKTVPALFGFPVEEETAPLTCRPWATWSLALVLTLVSLITYFDPANAIGQFGFIPAQPLRSGGLTFLTAFFLHGGILHLVGNLYFLLIFGDDVESYLGRRRWLLLIFLAAIGGNLVEAVIQHNLQTPCIGASGGISGIIAFYALEFPHARLCFLLRWHWVRLPAWSVFIVWMLLQTWGAHEELAGFSNVAALAHLGGALVGFLVWLVWRRPKLENPPPVSPGG